MIWLLYITSAIAYNWYKIERRGIKPTYFNSNWARAIFGLAYLVYMHPDFDPLGDITTWWKAIPILAFEISSFYLLFDPILNLTRGKPLLYRGDSSGWLDSLGLPYYILLKVFTLVVLTLSIYAISWPNV